MKKVISSKNVAAAIGPYSHAIQAEGKFVFLSGQIALDPTTGQVVNGGVEAETKQIMRNIEGLLKDIGAGFEQVVKSTIFLKDMNDFTLVNLIYGAYFRQNPPARSTVEVSRLPRDARVEIECIVCL